MTREETIKVLAVLKAAYPSFYKDMRRDEGESVVALWCDLFVDDDYQLVAGAVKALIATETSGYPPVSVRSRPKSSNTFAPCVPRCRSLRQSQRRKLSQFQTSAGTSFWTLCARS